jgi:hypothetical protein
LGQLFLALGARWSGAVIYEYYRTLRVVALCRRKAVVLSLPLGSLAISLVSDVVHQHRLYKRIATLLARKCPLLKRSDWRN